LDAVVYLEVPEAEILRRLSGRRICPNCGAIYQLDTMPPRREGICDKCGAALVQRADEQPEVVRNRLRVYETQTAPLLAYYQAQQRLHKVDGTIGVDNVMREIARILEEAKQGAGEATR
jgi:adenylate kinase